MKRGVVLLIPAILFLLISTANAGIWGESVAFNDLNDQRTFSSSVYNPPLSEGGLDGYWPYSFTINWDVSQDLDTMLWTYEYTLSATCKDLSHFILEVTSGTTRDDFMEFTINGKHGSVWDEIEGPTYFGQHPSNLGYPNASDIYGIKFEGGDLHTSTFKFMTALDPVWGNFYARNGKDKGNWVYAYNNALGIEDFNSDNKLDFIVRPDGGKAPPVIPEPISSILFIAGGTVLTVRRYWRAKRRTT